jgi:hypothetical protein
MKRDYGVPLAVQMADDVLGMHEELQRLRAENAELREYRKKYLAELDAGIAHGQHMVPGLLELAMKRALLRAELPAPGGSQRNFQEVLCE